MALNVIRIIFGERWEDGKEMAVTYICILSEMRGHEAARVVRGFEWKSFLACKRDFIYY